MDAIKRTLSATVATCTACFLFAAHGAPAHAGEEVSEPSSFTSMFTTTATPDMVVDEDGDPSPGEEGATGTFDFRINSDEEIICYDITLDGVTPPFESPAKTATHIHEGAESEAGPPRLAFPDPEDDGSGMMVSSGCIQGPFTTGLDDDDTGEDTAEGFTLSQIEDDPDSFYADTHTEDFLDGTVRGQLTEVPVGGMDTGAGGTSAGSTGGVLALGAAGLAALVAAGVMVTRRAV